MQFTDNNKAMKECPKPGCELIIEKSQFVPGNTVHCGCGNNYCFRCEEE